MRSGSPSGLCPMHARLLHMFENLPDIGHEPSMDNLFHSVLFSRMAHSIPQKVKVNGVIRKIQCGVPPCVFQEEKSGKAVEAARGTVKAAVLRGDSRSDNLIVASCFDQKPFYMITHSANKITWSVKTKMVWSAVLKEEVEFKFLRFSLSHIYNYEMNDNDIADQLRLVYRMQRFQRNQKLCGRVNVEVLARL